MHSIAQQASAEEPVEISAAAPCDQLGYIFDTLDSECSIIESCADLTEVERLIRDASHAKCASGYDELLEQADTCHIDGDLLFSTQLVMFQHRESAYECTQNYSRDIRPMLVRIRLEIAKIGHDPGEGAAEHLQKLVELRNKLSRIPPPPEKAPALDKNSLRTDWTKPDPAPNPDPNPEPEPILHLQLIEHFSLRANIGIGQVPEFLLESTETQESPSNVAIAPSFSAGARFPLGRATRHILGGGFTYTPVLRKFTTKTKAIFLGIHHLGPYARYGFRVHRNHFTPYFELSAGFQGFSSGSQIFTSFGQAKLGLCSLWQVLCAESSYISGWGGKERRKSDRATVWSIALGMDLLRLASVKRAIRNGT